MAKTVLVTGASRGIGRETALVFAKEGYNVIINYNTHGQDARRLKAEILNAGGRAEAIHADVSDRSQVEDMVGSCLLYTSRCV